MRSIFYSDVYERSKAIRGTRSTTTRTKCNLPSDNLTEGERRAKNGPVFTYRFVDGLSEEELKEWPADLREQYRARFGR